MRRRAAGLFFICSAVVPLAIVSTAWACGVLATLTVSDSTVTPGQVVQATGINYGRTDAATGSCGGGACSAVTLRWNSRTGPIIGTDPDVDSTGKINTPITIPTTAKAGDGLVLALQSTATGSPKSGTPGRTTVQVSGTNRTRTGEGVPGAAWGPQSTPRGPGGADAPIVLDRAGSTQPALLPTLLGGLLSIALLGTGLSLLRRGRTDEPALRV